jgi:hypothetical protein
MAIFPAGASCAAMALFVEPRASLVPALVHNGSLVVFDDDVLWAAVDLSLAPSGARPRMYIFRPSALAGLIGQ